MVSTWCLSFAVLPETSLYLGAAEQVFSAVGIQKGSRIDPLRLPSEEIVEICRAVAERARARGYLGICGFDVGTDSAGGVFVFDLNFRMNGSTPQVLMHAAAAARTGHRVSQSFGSALTGPLTEALARLRPYVEKGCLVPLRIFDGALAEAPDAPSFISGLVLADDDVLAAQLESEVSGLLAAGTDKCENPGANLKGAYSMGLLNVGDKAPDFQTNDQDGEDRQLKDFKGRKVVLYFYPKDDTPGCTVEACSFRDGLSKFRKLQGRGARRLGRRREIAQEVRREVRPAVSPARRHGQEDRPGLRRLGREVHVRAKVHGQSTASRT